jgi:hypothetical protein
MRTNEPIVTFSDLPEDVSKLRLVWVLQDLLDLLGNRV